MKGEFGKPIILAIFLAVTSKGIVHKTTARLPLCSKVMPSCKLHVEQLPQSPAAVIRKSHSETNLSMVSLGAGALALRLKRTSLISQRYSA